MSSKVNRYRKFRIMTLKVRITWELVNSVFLVIFQFLVYLYGHWEMRQSYETTCIKVRGKCADDKENLKQETVSMKGDIENRRRILLDDQ